MQHGKRALTNVQDAFLKAKLANNPEFKAGYFPNIVDEGPVSQYETNVPYDTPGSRINIRNLLPSRFDMMGGPPQFDVANIAAQEQFYKGEPTAKGQTQAINVNPDILASYGTAPSSPRNEMVNTPEWFKKIGEIYDFETGPTTDQATLNDTIEHILAHETGHGVSRLKPYLSDTEKAERFNFSDFLTANQKQGKKYHKEFGTLSFDQEELFNRMKDIERLKKAYPDSYEDHPLWDLYHNRAKMKFAQLTDQDWYKDKKLSTFDDYKKKIKPFVNKYFEKVEKAGSGIAGINIEKEEIGMPEHLTRVETPPREYGSPFAQGGRIGLAGGGALFKFIEKLFIKASNDIRLGRGKWKGLDQKQRIVQHDNLTKKVTEFQKSGKTVGMEEYFGVDPHTAFIAARDKVKRQGIIKDFPEVSGIDDALKSDFEKAAGGMDERTMLKQKYPKLTDDLLEKILIDDNPQRKADVLGTMDK
jgi:hypothetical protein